MAPVFTGRCALLGRAGIRTGTGSVRRAGTMVLKRGARGGGCAVSDNREMKVLPLTDPVFCFRLFSFISYYFVVSLRVALKAGGLGAAVRRPPAGAFAPLVCRRGRGVGELGGASDGSPPAYC